MAKKWTVTPEDYVTNNNNGTFTFPKNEGDTPKVYTIKFEDENGITANTTYTVNPCVCTLYSPVPESGILIYSSGSYSFTIFSYDDALGVSGNQRRPNVVLSNGEIEDEYIKVGDVTQSSNPYGLFYANYRVKKTPSSDYTTNFVVTNECHPEPINVKITIKAV